MNSPNSDKLDVSAIANSFNDLTITQVGFNVEITGLGTGNKIILEVVNSTALGQDDFVGW